MVQPSSTAHRTRIWGSKHHKTNINASDEMLRMNPQDFVCMLCSADKRRCCNSASQHRSHGYHNPFRRGTVDDSCPVCRKKFGNRAQALDHIAYRAKMCRQAFLTVAVLGLPRDTARADELEIGQPRVGPTGRIQGQ